MAKIGRPRTRFTSFCARCGKAFDSIPARVGRYCSRACYTAARVGSVRGPYVERQTKYCVTCERPFEVGGRGFPKRTQIFCSVRCQNRGRYQSGRQAKKMTPAQVAYLAGFIDGEGSIMLYRRKVGSVTLRLSVTNTCKRALDFIARAAGVGTVTLGVPDSDVRRAVWHWHINGDAALTTLVQIRRYLVIKREQADLGIAFQRRLRSPKLKGDWVWQHEWMAKIRHLNRRGPRPPEEREA